MPYEFNQDNFNAEVINSTNPVLVDFWAPWCGPCQRMAPILEEIENAYPGKLKVGKLNVDDNPALAQQYQVMSIPTLFVFKGGKIVEKIIGLTPREELEKMIQKHL